VTPGYQLRADAGRLFNKGAAFRMAGERALAQKCEEIASLLAEAAHETDALDTLVNGRRAA
jgi:hypothetical protein